VGAANSACDIALELYHKKAEVTMVVRAEEISPRVKYWIKPNILNRIKEGSIMTGYKPDYSLFKSLGIAIEEDDQKKPIHNADTYETNLPKVYVAGVIKSGMKTSSFFIENSRVDAERIINAISATNS